MSEPRRHASRNENECKRNRRKIMHQARCVIGELEFLLAEHAKREVNLKYALSKALKLLNRAKEFK